uniref:Uncharacterized protein n=1 Tax=Eucampia antarctica TaxID=49252 RepID=A0A7S2WQD8_9STRA|mmetsp:Transcript_8244/g.7771  ORF Transcript_8244/g.7771 Transcript_8244/m.7771 type:complete len:723 (+) Transcript_8244:128-2296(+)|eukprot:CAMPEP_0197827936 /NCGR_PEP_ID=MMETSP1437-20131217/4603_1 /TAXON_ID=49252 ORGANISM="Eucampia antarctica, Strain CCMP1452" /NCGR_SAMPLE_ID=MMETSP1437 /ASSEMBLY_ACC=CAM_ASM_001096 /LENGTH=722 /DNA_ID=CAMNT_0043428963 /DNA_START=116 /DNA_END=2284 /DNA_ORIENTATION=+
MVHASVRLERLVSTKCGMRRILKQPQHSVPDYIRSAVQSGVYKVEGQEQQQQQGGGGRGRGRGSQQSVAYPVEYDILSMNPPIPQPPRVPLKYQNNNNNNKNNDNDSSISGKYNLPTDALIQSYLKRYDTRIQQSQNVTATEEDEAYLAKILGIHSTKKNSNNKESSSSTSFTAMGRKNTVLSNAYQFALRQYQVLQENKEMSEEESVNVVEQLLQSQNQQERHESRQRTQNVLNWRTQKTEDAQQITANHKYNDAEPTEQQQEDDISSNIPVSTVPSVLFNKPRTIQAMRIWAQRLQAVPYDQWTIGAATALDHWIAVEVLALTEQTWDSLLDGNNNNILMDTLDDNNSNNNGDVGNIARTSHIVSVRKALFPETILFSATATQQDLDSIYNDEQNMSSSSTSSTEEDDDHKDDELDATERSIDELLASLGGFEEQSDYATINTDNKKEQQPESEDIDQDILLAEMVDKLQDWRLKNQELPYESWQTITKHEFNTWLSRYVEVLASEVDKLEEVDMEATRKALFSEPATTRDQSDSFWAKLRDESEAEVFLQRLLEEGSLPQESNQTSASKEAFAAFLELPYQTQLRKLVDVGTLRPILDEYQSESDRSDFNQRYGETLMEGVEVEHLVPDPLGPIRGQDLEGTEFNSKAVKKEDRFRIQLIEHGTDEYGTPRSERARALYRAWNTMKSGRARYEELLFRKGKLGLKATTTTTTTNKSSTD